MKGVPPQAVVIVPAAHLAGGTTVIGTLTVTVVTAIGTATAGGAVPGLLRDVDVVPPPTEDAMIEETATGTATVLVTVIGTTALVVVIVTVSATATAIVNAPGLHLPPWLRKTGKKMLMTVIRGVVVVPLHTITECVDFSCSFNPTFLPNLFCSLFCSTFFFVF